MSAPTPMDAKLDEKLRKMYRDIVGSPIRMTFWGGMILDPDKVFVTEEQAERSARYLEKMLSTQRSQV